jgi:hypothetical protein
MEVHDGEEMEKGREHRFSEKVRITKHRLTRIPARVAGIEAFPSALKDGEIALTEKNAESVFRGFLQENKDFFQVRDEELKMISTKSIGDKWLVKFQQHIAGIPVHQATVGFVTSSTGKVHSYSSNYYPGIDIPEEAEISLQEAAEIAKKSYESDDAKSLTERESQKIVFPKEEKGKLNYHLAWKFLLASDRPNPELEKYFIINAIDGEILFSYDARFPGVKVSGRVTGEIYPENPNAPPVSIEPMRDERNRIRYSGSSVTKANGNYSKILSIWATLMYWIRRRISVTFTLEGPFSRVQDDHGNDYIERRSFRSFSPCDFTWAAVDRDHINVFYHMNLFHTWLRTQLNYNWVNAWDGTRQFKAEVNHPENNAYAGNPMLFGVNEFARSSDVIYHECTHNVLVHLYGDYIGWPARYTEGYALDEGFSDYFASAFTDDSIHGEGYTANPRDLNNNDQYPGRVAYNLEGHRGGEIIGGAAWDLRQLLIAELGAVNGARTADRLLFEAHQILATHSRDYFFSDPKESNLLTCLYLADDDNDNLEDGVPHFAHIQRAFANHNLLQARFVDRDSFDFSTNTIGWLSGGDLYYKPVKFYANNTPQRGVIDLGNIGNVALDQVNIPNQGYTRYGVDATVDHTYVALAQEGEEGNHIVFRVTEMAADQSEVTIEYLYRSD